MALDGGCHCGAVRYSLTGDPDYSALCLCTDCRKSAGAHLVGWALFREDQVAVSGTTRAYNSSGDIERHFCEHCGTGLFYLSASIFPGKIDVQTATLDDPAALPPQSWVQVADAPDWVQKITELSQYMRYPA
jgi:hypothetical protein